MGEDSCPDGFSLEVQVGVGRGKEKALSCGCWMALNNYNAFTGPYQDLQETHIRFSHFRPPDDDEEGAAAERDFSDRFAHAKVEEEDVEEEKDYSDRFAHPKVVDEEEVEEKDYSDRFEHAKVERGGEHELYGNARAVVVMDTKYYSGMVYVAAGVVALVLAMMGIAKCVSRGKQVIVHGAASYEQ